VLLADGADPDQSLAELAPLVPLGLERRFDLLGSDEFRLDQQIAEFYSHGEVAQGKALASICQKARHNAGKRVRNASEMGTDLFSLEGQVSTCHFASQRWQAQHLSLSASVIREDLTPLFFFDRLQFSDEGSDLQLGPDLNRHLLLVVGQPEDQVFAFADQAFVFA